MLFDRRVAVEIGRPGFPGRRIEGLRIDFDITKTRTRTADTGKVSIWNPSKDTIALARTEGSFVRLFAGYGFASLIYTGKPVKNGIKESRNGGGDGEDPTDNVLSFELKDSVRELTEERVDLKFDGSVSYGSVLNDVIDAFSVPRGTITATFPAVRLPAGHRETGTISDILDRLANIAGADWFITDGAVNFIPSETGDVGLPAIEVSARNKNLIGSPTETENGVEVKMLLQQNIIPGSVFQLESDRITGAFAVSTAQYKGDSGFAQDFYTIATGRVR